MFDGRNATITSTASLRLFSFCLWLGDGRKRERRKTPLATYTDLHAHHCIPSQKKQKPRTRTRPSTRRSEEHLSNSQESDAFNNTDNSNCSLPMDRSIKKCITWLWRTGTLSATTPSSDAGVIHTSTCNTSSSSTSKY